MWRCVDLFLYSFYWINMQNNCQCQYQLWKCQKFIELLKYYRNINCIYYLNFVYCIKYNIYLRYIPYTDIKYHTATHAMSSSAENVKSSAWKLFSKACCFVLLHQYKYDKWVFCMQMQSIQKTVSTKNKKFFFRFIIKSKIRTLWMIRRCFLISL